jgi:5-methyltetrahydrofolate--homocysteine methyltransferase
MRDRFNSRQSEVEYVTLAEARANKYEIDWSRAEIKKPNLIGVKVFEDYPIDDLVPYIDWSPFFSTWGIAGSYPRILESAKYGTEATKLFNEAQEMLKEFVDEKSITAKAVIGIFPAYTVDETIQINGTGLAFHQMRQQVRKEGNQKNVSLSDFIAPADSGREDYVGAFAVTAGIGIERKLEEFEKNHDDYSSIMLKALI